MRGLPLLDIGRAANLLWIHFGHPRLAPTAGDPEREVGEYALHVQCPWRVSGVTGVLAGSSDVYVPADPDAGEESFRWDKPGDSIVDLHLERWIETHSESPLIVDLISVDRCGGFVLALSNEFAIEVFPDASSEPHDVREQWRLFRPGVEDEEHFVVLNQGIE